MKFLWWDDGDFKNDLEEYEMCVHTFGGTSSPSCCNYSLRKTASNNREHFGDDAYFTLLKNFYVDDMLKAYPSIEAAIKLLPKIQKMCSKGGFKLTKFISNIPKVLSGIPESDQSRVVKEMLLGNSTVERALGVTWNIGNDCLSFQITLKDCPLSRRGMLSTISSIYDPLGLAGPFLLKGKLLLQQLCADKLTWDKEVPEAVRMEWL